jgi:hypothetical protein
MKKLIFGLIATVVFGFNGNANNLNYNFKNNSNNLDDLGRKPGWHYAIVDAGGAKAGFEMGAATGHPLLMSAGLVFGAVLGSSYAWYMDTNYGRIAYNNNSFPKEYSNSHDEIGVIHNDYVQYLIEKKLDIKSESEFIDLVYDDLALQISKRINIDLSTLKKSYTKQMAISDLKDVNQLSMIDTDGYEETINMAVEQIQKSTKNEKISSYLKVTFLKFSKENNIEDVLNGLNTLMLSVENEKNLTDLEKQFLRESLSVYKYSSYLWFYKN